MKKTFASVTLVFLFSLAFAVPAFGLAILVDDNRFVKSAGRSFVQYQGQSWNDIQMPNSLFEDFDETIYGYQGSYAQQLSTVTPTRFEATGSVSINMDVNVVGLSSGQAGARQTVDSLFEIGFDLLEPHRYDLSGSVASGGLLVLDGDETGNIFDIGSDGTTQAGLLQPGSYLLRARAFDSCALVNCEAYAGGGSYQLSFEIYSVPEPSSILLICTGLLGLAVPRIRRKLHR